jgi:hypothetical protein
MTTFHSRQSNRGRRAHKKANADTFNFASQIPPSICAVMHTKHDKRGATIFKSLCKRTVVSKCFYRVEALPLVKTRFLRLVHISPKIAQSPARWSRDGRETSGKLAVEMSCGNVAQFPGNSRAAANAMPPNVRQDDSQANLPCAGLGRAISARILARRLATRSRDSRATVKATSCKTTRSNLNHDIQRL